MPESTHIPDHEYIRIDTAARQLYESRTGLNWEDLALGTDRFQVIAEAVHLVKAIDAADGRIRLTLGEFNAIRADAVRDVHYALLREMSGDDFEHLATLGVPEAIHNYSLSLKPADHDPKNLDEALGALVRERVSAELNVIADSLDAGDLREITAGLDIDRESGITPRFKRRMIAGCADWIRTRSVDILDTNKQLRGRRPAARS